LTAASANGKSDAEFEIIRIFSTQMNIWNY